MRPLRKRRRMLLGGIAAAMFVVLCAVGCTPQAGAPSSDVPRGASVETTTPLFQPALNPDGPVIKQEGDALVERTPMSADDYNVKVLDADARGCYACHGNLNELMITYHPTHNPSAGLTSIQPTIEQCLDCHNTTGFGGNLGDLVHAIHNVESDSGDVGCFNCHSTVIGEGMKLWDQVKYDELQGIVPVENPNGAFSFDQDYTVPQSEMPNTQWMNTDFDLMRFDKSQEDAPLDQEMFDTWEISVTGEVAAEQTWTLPDLIAEAEQAGVVERRPLVAQCIINPLGGESVGQVEITGIPVEWMLEKVTTNSNAVSLTWFTPDGTVAGFHGLNLADLSKFPTYLVYEMNGEPISWNNGYPCVLWVGGLCADHLAKNVSELRISTDDYAYSEEITMCLAKPNLGIMGTPEGRVISVGEAYAFEGWANGFEVPIAALEFSLDKGETWQRCETPGTDALRWVHWRYEFVPPAENGDTAYVLYARAVGTDGSVSPNPVKVMVNAKTEMPQPTN